MIKKLLVFTSMILIKMERISGRTVHPRQLLLPGCHPLLKWQFWAWTSHSNPSVKTITITCVHGETFILPKKQEKNISLKVLNEFKMKIVTATFNFLNIINTFKAQQSFGDTPRELVLPCMFHFLCCMVNGTLELGIITLIVFLPQTSISGKCPNSEGIAPASTRIYEIRKLAPSIKQAGGHFGCVRLMAILETLAVLHSIGNQSVFVFPPSQ